MAYHTHNGRPCKSFGSCALENFNKIHGVKNEADPKVGSAKVPSKKHEVAKKMKRSKDTKASYDFRGGDHFYKDSKGRIGMK